MDGETQREPYMGNIVAVRASGNQVLFDSEHRHQHFITLYISTASRRRSLSNDWIHPENRLIELCMSEAQWATMISSIGLGKGVPVTLKHTESLGDIKSPKLEQEDRSSLFRPEVEKNTSEALALIDELLATRTTKTQDGILEMIRSKITSSQSFVAEQFDEHAEKTVERAKAEVHAYMTNAIQSAGLEALGVAPLLLETDNDEI